MAKYSSKELDAVYHALANATRRRILTRLCTGNCTVGELAKPFEMTLAGVSKHIKVLEKAGLVKKTPNGLEHICSIEFEPIRSAGALIDYFTQFLPPEEAAAEEEAPAAQPAASAPVAAEAVAEAKVLEPA